MNIYFDLETVPCQLPGIKEELAAAVTAPGQFKKAESIAEWLKENREAEAEKAWLNTSFDGGLGQICVIGWAIDDGLPHALSVDDLGPGSEGVVISEWFATIAEEYRPTNTPRFIGHNVVGFDFPFLWKRAMVLGVKPPVFLPRNPKPWGDVVVDTMMLWDGQQRAGGSMDRICKLMGIPGKGDMDGSKVWPYIQSGRIDEVAEYCKGDVDRTRAMFKRMTFSA